MILESASLQVKPGESADFEAAFRVAERIIASMPGYRSHELQRCLEREGYYLLLVRWDSVEAHEEGFRKSALCSNIKRISEETWESINRLVVAYAQSGKVEKGRETRDYHDRRAAIREGREMGDGGRRTLASAGSGGPVAIGRVASGTVTAGQDVADRISQVECDSRDHPREEIALLSVTVQ